VVYVSEFPFKVSTAYSVPADLASPSSFSETRDLVLSWNRV